MAEYHVIRTYRNGNVWMEKVSTPQEALELAKSIINDKRVSSVMITNPSSGKENPLGLST